MVQNILNFKSYKRKKILIILTLLIIALELSLTSYSFCNSEKPIKIHNLDELQKIEDNLNENYILAEDINATETQNWNNGKGFNPIGKNSEYPFTGTFDGEGHVIENLHINRPKKEHVGLFGFIKNSEIKRIGLKNAEIKGGSTTGGIVGRNDEGKISNSFAKNFEISGAKAGGLIGFNYKGELVNSHSAGSVKGDYIGGLVGINYVNSIVKNSYSTSNVSGKEKVGNLIGANRLRGTVIDSFFDRSLSEENKAIGKNGGTTSNVKALSTVEMTNVSIFNDAGWNITAVYTSKNRNVDYIWNIVNGETYPFLSWETQKTITEIEKSSEENTNVDENNGVPVKRPGEYFEETKTWTKILLIGILITTIVIGIKSKLEKRKNS